MRDLFLLDPGIVFLNHGSFGACPAAVLAAQHRWQREMERNPVEFLGRRSADLLAKSRARLATFLGASPTDLVYVTNATTGVNAVAASLDLDEGDEVITTDHEYGACDAALAHIAHRRGARVVRVPISLPFRRSEFADRMVAAITSRTRAMFCSHITSVTAVILPVEELCRRARARGILTLIDGAHAPGHIPLDLTEVGADYYVGNCHKWMCAPKGAAFLHARAEHHERLAAPVMSWGYCDKVRGHVGLEAFTGSTVLERRLQWQGTRDISAFLAVEEALSFMDRNNWSDAREAFHRLAGETRDRVDAMTGLSPICTANDFGQMVSIAVPGSNADLLRAGLFERYRIEVPVTWHSGHLFVRPAFHWYTDRADADALVAALDELLRPRA